MVFVPHCYIHHSSLLEFKHPPPLSPCSPGCAASTTPPHYQPQLYPANKFDSIRFDRRFSGTSSKSGRKKPCVEESTTQS